MHRWYCNIGAEHCQTATKIEWEMAPQSASCISSVAVSTSMCVWLTSGADLDFCFIVIKKMSEWDTETDTDTHTHTKRERERETERLREQSTLSLRILYTIWKIKPWNWSKNLTSIMSRFPFFSFSVRTKVDERYVPHAYALPHDDVYSMQLSIWWGFTFVLRFL